MKPREKLTSLIVAMVMLFGAAAYLANEINEQGKTYKVGDRGPGGGFVFYDKGSNSGGWRYLEAAPKDQGKAVWGCPGTSIKGAEGTVFVVRLSSYSEF